MNSSGYESAEKIAEKPLSPSFLLKQLTVSDSLNNNEEVSDDDMSAFDDSISQVAFRRLDAKYGGLSFFEQVRQLGFQSLDFLDQCQRTQFNAYLDWIATRFPHGVRTVTLLRSLERDNLSKHFDLPALLAVFGSNTTHLALAPSYIELHFESGGVLKNGELDSYKASKYKGVDVLTANEQFLLDGAYRRWIMPHRYSTRVVKRHASFVRDEIKRKLAKMPDFNPDNTLHVVGYVFVEYYKQIMRHLTVTQKTRKYPQENIYEMSETLTENETCSRMLLFVCAEAGIMNDSAKSSVKRMLTIDMDDISHEKLIMAVLTYNYTRKVFNVEVYPSDINKLKIDYVDLMDNYHVDYASKKAVMTEQRCFTVADTSKFLATSLRSFDEVDSRGFYPHASICAFVSACDEIAVQNQKAETKILAVLNKLAEEAMSPKFTGARETNVPMSQYHYFCEGREHEIKVGLMMAWRNQTYDKSGNNRNKEIDEWHRVIVTKIVNQPGGYLERMFRRSESGHSLPPCSITVHLVDWGYREVTSPAHLRFLPYVSTLSDSPAAGFRAVYGTRSNGPGCCNYNKCLLYEKTTDYFGSDNVVYYRIKEKTNCTEPVKVEIYRDHKSLEKLDLEVYPKYYYNNKYAKKAKHVKCITY